MNERLFARLARLLEVESVVLASVLATRGATPRKGGSKMLITDSASEFSVGGGEAEARVLLAARALLRDGTVRSSLSIDLSGKPGAAGVCGGSMQLSLRRWSGVEDLSRARALSAELRAGKFVRLSAADLGTDAGAEPLQPDARLLIVGGGHCAAALHQFAQLLDFEIWVFDQRSECFGPGLFSGATCLTGDFGELAQALATDRDVYAVLLNRNFISDVAALTVLCDKPPQFLGMMGSRKRIAEVISALGDQHATALRELRAPVGLDIDAETPHEIAVSILAQLIQSRRRREDSLCQDIHSANANDAL